MEGIEELSNSVSGSDIVNTFKDFMARVTKFEELAAVGSKLLSGFQQGLEDRFMGDDGLSKKRVNMKKGMGRKSSKGGRRFGSNASKKRVSGRDQGTKDTFGAQTTVIRKQVEPETVKYFSEIANLLESDDVDFEERSVICGNALEEATGKEFELATDYIISHTLQTLLEGCDADHLCSFLRSSADDFPLIAMDRSGSHVTETAIKSLSLHLQDKEVYWLVEETLTVICKVIVANPIDVMCNCYGSHVLRSLLSLLKGVSSDSLGSRATESSNVLAERLNTKAHRVDGDESLNFHEAFPGLLNFLIYGMLNGARGHIKILQDNQYSSFVLQTSLKLLVGHDDDLAHIISIILGCDKGDIMEEDCKKLTFSRNVVNLMKETAFSRLMEVILEVAPERLYNGIFSKVFRHILFELSSHQCGNFVVQALMSHARHIDQMELIWSELGLKFKDLLELGRSGVIASIIAASQRLRTKEQQCCQALVDAICSDNESPRCIVPRLLFLDNFFFCEDKSNWEWPTGAKMHIVGSLILQEVFRYKSEIILPFFTSITSLEADHVLEAAKDKGGSRVIEAFLSSDASTKMKRKLVVKLRGHYGDLSMHSSSSFTIEKCFNASNLSFREVIVFELAAVLSQVSKTKHGPHLLRKLDVDGFAARPDQWRSRQESKQSAYKEFHATFGESTNDNRDAHDSDQKQQAPSKKGLKNLREEKEQGSGPGTQFLSESAYQRKPKKIKREI